MTSPHTTRRYAIVGIVSVSVLLCAGLGWATKLAIERDHSRAMADRSTALEITKKLAVARLDTLVTPIIQRETRRPYNHFLRYYRPFFEPMIPPVSDDESMPPLSLPKPVESPLSTDIQPPWTLLHFTFLDAEEASVWLSPQIEPAGFDPATPPAGVFPSEERQQLATPENWLAALIHTFPSNTLQADYEEAMTASRKMEGEMEELAVKTLASEETAPPHINDEASPHHLTGERLHVAREHAKLLKEELNKQIDQCVVEAVAKENLSPEDVYSTSQDTSATCTLVTLSDTAPVWLSLTDDDQRQLALLRRVTIEEHDGHACAIQGVLIDWTWLAEALNSQLQDQIGNEFSHAWLVPVLPNTDISLELLPTMLSTIPARVDFGRPLFTGTPPVSGGLKAGLAVAWLATILAVLAVSYGTMKYVTLTERRMRFVSAATHELRTPLTSFQLYTDLLAEEVKDGPERPAEHVATLQTESKRLARLVENVLSYSRMADAKPTLHCREIAAGEVLGTLERDTTRRCESAGKQIVIDNQCDDTHTIESDPEFIEQILVNLVENACKYSTEANNPRVWISAIPTPDGGITFEIDDAGPGVAPHERKTVFEPFRRSNTAQSNIGGMGLGLALSRYWATSLGGSLTVSRSDRTPAHAYARFTLTLPAKIPHA